MRLLTRSILQQWSHALLLSTFLASNAFAQARIVGGPCEGCENVFVGMPKELGPRARIAPIDEPGEPMVIEGIVRYLDGEPAEGVIVYAYQTDSGGRYPGGETSHGRLRGWARTTEAGEYWFDTIRPGAYPGMSIPQHVHMHVIEPGRVTYYIDDVLFEDDPLLTSAHRRRYVRDRGGSGVGHPEKDADGIWRVRRDIILGKNIPEYPCPRRWTSPVPFYQSVSWSPDGLRLAISAVTTNWYDGYRIFVCDADGSSPVRLETGGDRELYPVWSPDGSRIAFSSRRAGNSDIYAMRSDGSDLVRLTHHEANDNYPWWSPDGTRLVFHSDRDGDYDIYVMNFDGSEIVQVTDHPSDDYNPSWSPDGSRIAFDSDRDAIDGDEIYIVAPDGTGTARVVDAGVFPTWSPDGSRILYAMEGLYVVNADGSGNSRLLERSVYGAWSPDGSAIAAAAIEYDESCRDEHHMVTCDTGGGGRKRILPPR